MRVVKSKMMLVLGMAGMAAVLGLVPAAVAQQPGGAGQPAAPTNAQYKTPEEQLAGAKQNRPAREAKEAYKVPNDATNPLVGKQVYWDMGGNHQRLDYHSTTEMELGVADRGKNPGVLVKVFVTTIRPNVYMVNWTEPSGAYITHVEDYENMVIYTNIATANGSIRQMGKIEKIVDAPK
jgi:hypothetical protein